MRIFSKKRFTSTPFLVFRSYFSVFIRSRETISQKISYFLEVYRSRKTIQGKVWGFTLIEMIVYAAILGILAVLTVNSTLAMTNAYVNLRVSRDLNSSATAVLERMTREIRGAYNIQTATWNDLILNTKDAGGANTTVEFYVENNLIKVKEGGIAKGPLMALSTNVTNFVPTSITTTNSKAVKVELTLGATRGTVSKTRNFYTTVVLRGTY